MIPRAMLAMREPCERREKKNKTEGQHDKTPRTGMPTLEKHHKLNTTDTKTPTAMPEQGQGD